MALADGRSPPPDGAGAAEPPVRYQRSGRVAFVTLNRPSQLNAVNAALVDELCACLDIAAGEAAEDRIGAVVLSGAGRAFSAGHDLNQDVEKESGSTARSRLEAIQDITRKIQQLAVPVVAAVHGFALGAGCELALVCDLVVAHPGTVLGFPEVEVGLGVTGGATYLLPILVGPAKAKELVLLGTRIDAAEAKALGLVNILDADVLGRAGRWADELAGRPRLALCLAKRALDRGPQGDMTAAFELEVTSSLALRGTPEAAAAAKAFRRRHESSTHGS